MVLKSDGYLYLSKRGNNVKEKEKKKRNFKRNMNQTEN